jgi:hypothetical protein
MPDSLMRVTLRAAGRLANKGVPLAVTSALILDAFKRSGLAEEPSSKAHQMNATPAMVGGGTFTQGLWCHSCQLHRVTLATELCPVCRDDLRRGAA